MPAGDVLTSYRPNQYQYGTKGYYSAISGWTGTYQDEGVDYNLNYSYPMLSQDTSHMVQGYGRYGSGKPVYVDTDTSTYSYNLVHRPAVSSESPNGFSLTGMAASLPNTSDRVPSNRLLPQVNRTLTSPASYRTDGLPSFPGSKTSPTSPMSDVGYNNLHSSFESPYSPPSTLGSNIPHRSSNAQENSTYQSGPSSTTESLYPAGDQSLRSAEDSNAGLSYIYSDKLEGSRRDSQSSGGGTSGSVLPNGHVYVPDSHHPHIPSSSSQSYIAPQNNAVDGGTTSSGRGSGSSGSSHMHAESHRRSAGNLRGG